jgi:hypothetical protein
VSDSASGTRWQSFASAEEVRSFLTELEDAAMDSWAGVKATWNSPGDQAPDTPVSVVSQPSPVYPSRLAAQNKAGRVWMSYVVSATGRPDGNSFVPLLSDDSLFTEAAKQALLRGRFQPAVLKGQPIPLRVFQVILFRNR